MSSTLTSTHRSKTLPTSLDALPVTSAASKQNNHSTSTRLHLAVPSAAKSNGQQRKARTAVVGSTAGLAVGGVSSWLLSPLTSPRHDEREDPFSLGSFFPSRPGSPSNEPLSWLSPTEETVQEVEEEVEVERRTDVVGIVPSRSLSLTALDDYAKEVIAKEESLGILSLIRIPFFFQGAGASPVDDTDEDELDVPATPTSMALDEPYDDETLYATLCSRRAAASAKLPVGSVPGTGTGLAADGVLGTFSLFSPATETREAELGWANALYTKMLGDY